MYSAFRQNARSAIKNSRQKTGRRPAADEEPGTLTDARAPRGSITMPEPTLSYCELHFSGGSDTILQEQTNFLMVGQLPVPLLCLLRRFFKRLAASTGSLLRRFSVGIELVLGMSCIHWRSERKRC